MKIKVTVGGEIEVDTTEEGWDEELEDLKEEWEKEDYIIESLESMLDGWKQDLQLEWEPIKEGDN